MVVKKQINLNSPEFTGRTLATKAKLLEHIDPIDVYLQYMPDVDGSLKAMISPLRDEKRPSFGLFEGESGELCFKDFVLGVSGDFIDFVMRMFDLTWYEAISKIIVDFDLTKYFLYKENTKKTDLKIVTDEQKTDALRATEKRRVGIKTQPFKMRDIAYWRQFGISKATLDKYNVFCPLYIFLIKKNSETIITAKPFTYAFLEKKDNVGTYKIYQPYSKDHKWYNNHDSSVWQGWEQLPEIGEKLIITKSLKDVMAITEITGIPAVSLQAESVAPKISVMAELKERFNYIYVLYDNDYDKRVNWGREFAKNLVEAFDLLHIEIHKDWESKDFTDLVKKHGKVQAKEVLIREINDTCPF